MAERRQRGPATFRERDVKAAIRAAEAAGKEVVAVRIVGGAVEVVTCSPGERPREAAPAIPEGLRI